MDNDQTPANGTAQVNVTPPETPVEENPTTGAEPVEPNVPQQQPAPPQPDYAEKFKQSAREAQILLEQKKRLEDRIRTLTTQDAPTDSDLKERYPEWDQYNSFTKTVLTNQLVQERANAQLRTELLEITAERKWQTELKELTAKPRYAKLKNDAAFEAFVFQPKHKGLDITVLADAFLFTASGAGDDTVSPETPPAPVSRREVIPRGSGGGRTQEAAPKYTDEELTAMRTSDPKLFRQLLKEGKVTIG